MRAAAALAMLLTVLSSASAPAEVAVQEIPQAFTIDDPRFVAPAAYRADVLAACAEFGVPVDIAVRLAFEESSWRPDAVNTNRNGTVDRGLYQLNSAYFDDLQPRDNIRTGLAHLAYCYSRAGTWHGAVVAYNAGPTKASQGRAPASSYRLADRVTGGQL
jgi:soluble lytic murein transglycosylase-like protein